MNRATTAALLALALAAPVRAEPPETVDQVDVSRYMGRWYEIALLPNFFQRGCARDTTATYALREDGRVSVTNRCVTGDGEVQEVEGVARVAEPATNAKLEVSFFSLFGKHLFWGDYWVLDLGDDYQYALIGTPSRRWAWILSRDPNPPEARVQEWLATMGEKGFDPTEFERSPQTPLAQRNDRGGTP
jgi:apolipoprotein D and lipocalin family protein